MLSICFQKFLLLFLFLCAIFVLWKVKKVLVGKKIKEVRKIRGYTQKQLGELCNIAEPTIRRYELGKLNPKYETIKKIAKALNVPASYLLNYDDSVKDIDIFVPPPNLEASIIRYNKDLRSIIKSIINTGINDNSNSEVLSAYVSALKLFYDDFSDFDFKLIGINTDEII